MNKYNNNQNNKHNNNQILSNMTHKSQILRALSVLMLGFLWCGMSAQAAKRPWVKVENSTLTFSYGEKPTLAADEYELNEGRNDPAWKDRAGEITKAVIDKSFSGARPTSCYGWFSGCENLTSIEGLANLNTSEVTTMRLMFDECSLLESIDLSGFDTRKVTDMSFMFAECSSVTSLDVSSFDTQNVTNMTFMFGGMYNVQHIFASDKFTTGKVTGGDDMFGVCFLLSGAIGFDFGHDGKEYANTQTGLLTDVRQKDNAKYYWVRFDNGTLTYCYGKKTSLAAGESYMRSIMDGAPSNPSYSDDVTTAVIDESFRDARPTYCRQWFAYANLTEIKGLENFNTSELTNMSFLFSGCQSLRSLDLSSFDTSKATTMNSMFSDCYALQTLNLSSFDTSNVTSMSGMFDYCCSMTGLDISSLNTSKVTNMNMMFYACTSMRYIFVGDGFKTGQVAESRGMFLDCYSLAGAMQYQEDKTGVEYANTTNGYFTNVELKDQATYGWTRHDGNTLTFYYGKKPALEANERYVTARHVTSEPWMNGITNVRFDESFKAARPEACSEWFNGFGSLTSIEGWENLNTDNVTDMDNMFTGCEKLESLDLSTVNTQNVVAMVEMFAGCTNLKAIYVGAKFSTTKADECEDTFNGCPATIYCPANSYAALSQSKLLADRELMAYTDIGAAAEYGTLCVPVGSDLADGTYAGFDGLYTVSQCDAAGGYALLKEARQLLPGVAYIYHRSIPADCAKAVVAYRPNASTATEPVAGGLLRGTFTATTAPAGSYTLHDGGVLRLAAADGSTAVNANQAYLQPEAGATLPDTLSLKTEGETGVNAIVSGSDGTGHDRVYDLLGCPANILYKGRVYIRNGKKVVR